MGSKRLLCQAFGGRRPHRFAVQRSAGDLRTPPRHGVPVGDRQSLGAERWRSNRRNITGEKPAIESDLQFIMGQLARIPDRMWLSWMLLLGSGSP